MEEIIKKCLEEQYNNRVTDTIYKIVKFNFPNIKNLSVTSNSITFDDTGDYTKEEIQNFIEDFRKNASIN